MSASAAPLGRHPALSLDLGERVDYAIAVASVAYADGAVSDREIQRIRTIGTALDIGPEEMGRVCEAAARPDHVRLRELAERWRHTATSYALLTDAIIMAFSDGRVTDSESHCISEFADMLDIDVAQATYLARYVETVVLHKDEEPLGHKLADDLSREHRHEPGTIRRLLEQMKHH